MLLTYEPTLKQLFEDIGRYNAKVYAPIKIRTQPHDAQQTPNYQIPKALREEVTSILKEQIVASVLEPYYSLYRNLQFLVKKKNSKYRLINSAIYINTVTIRDALIPPNIKEFAKDITERLLISLVDMFSSYNNLLLYKESRDITAIITPLSLLR